MQIGDPPQPDDLEVFEFDLTTTNNNNNINNNNINNNMNDESFTAIWRERERRQRTIRLFMMFLVMLLLMDGEEGQQRKNAMHKRSQKEWGKMQKLDADVFQSRQVQEQRIRSYVKGHKRYAALVEMNGKEDLESSVYHWAEQRAEQEKDQFPESAKRSSRFQPGSDSDPDDARKVFHYPWNATGFYRGQWMRLPFNQSLESGEQHPITKQSRNSTSQPVATVVYDAKSLEEPMEKIAMLHGDRLGVFLLRDGMQVQMRNDNNLTSMKWEDLRTDGHNAIVRSDSNVAPPSSDLPVAIPLTQDSGRAVFQFFSRSVPAMKELSLVDGFIKIYDSNSIGYSTRKDILLRVRGVVIHSIGRLSLVSTTEVSQTVMYVPGDERETVKRRLEESLNKLDDADMNAIREDAHALFAESVGKGVVDWSLVSAGDFAEESVESIQEHVVALKALTDERALQQLKNSPGRTSTQDRHLQATSGWSDAVLPYPFVRDDAKETIRRVKTPAAREMPAREKDLEQNAAGCGFEISLDVGTVDWTVGAWRQLVSRKVMDTKRLNPLQKDDTEDNYDTTDTPIYLRGSWGKPIQDQAVVMTLVGTIHSTNCNFTAALNATALRTDWETATSKAINYSFVMMLICLTQMLVLLRQVLHSQGVSAATRVSILCVGWQTLLDALLCIMHIYMSLSIQPLFSAFASVAFFKLLIFCVIQMKYMAIIIQARNSSNGGQPMDVLRRQIALLHVRFYTVLAGTFVLFFYVNDKYRALYILALFSFWVPQIIMNIYTEAKTPLHNSYILGMSISRLFAPLYFFAIRNNFLKEVYPEAPHDTFTCNLLVLWVGLQTAVLYGQRKYGARFMIPARCLPPKFDYSRPIPASMLPPGALDPHVPATESMEDRDAAPHYSIEQSLSSGPPSGRHKTAMTTRNRMRGNRAVSRAEGVMTTEQHRTGLNGSPLVGSTTAVSNASLVHGLECSICYEGIDIQKRSEYMLAPCNHLFHRECLVQWMDVKMECPICRTNLPVL
ncbi:hypothetical protein FisN_21Lh067 [Fistulifera solaris]|uniref:RING-type E3 ubiquitin transferase n=1 Tax=Fistulifera solaris TaxID=1519565 RepID=A0A1Z5KJW3_FISSO|nr:hypothetical protein FisN_21Lh067 [Fistulifera solaris]|eukprot:GAX26600.1 hypothetical protein FisN_21Lh067 [Fistulifera solaris]